MVATAGEARKGIYRGFESTSRAGSRSIFRQKKSRVFRRARMRMWEREGKEERKREGWKRERKEQPSRNVTNSIHEAAASNLRRESNCISIDSKKIWAVVRIYIARGCETHADLLSNSVTRAEFDYVGSLTLHHARVHTVG